jgi:plasmid maintenance system antidote protein VapI
MDERTQMRMELAKTQVKSREVAELLGLHFTTLSSILAGRRPMPADFSERFYGAIQTVVQERAASIRRQAEQEANRILETAGIVR